MNLHPDCYCASPQLKADNRTCHLCLREQFTAAVQDLDLNDPADYQQYRKARVTYLGYPR